MYGERVATRGRSRARGLPFVAPLVRTVTDSKRFRVWSFAVAAWRWSLARRVLRYVLIPGASCPSIPHVKALCLLAACMHARDYERKSQIFVADSTFFCSQRDCRPILLVFFFPSGRSSTLFCMPSDALGYFVFLWDRGGREILRQGNSLTEFLIRAPISRLWGKN